MRSRRTSGPLARAVIVLCLAFSSWNTGCEGSSSIELTPVFPTDEADLLDRAEIEKLVVTLSTDSPTEALAPIDLLRDESLRIEDIEAGTWKVKVSGVDQNGDEVVHGETALFEVKPGVAKKVPLFIGRSYAFNLAGLEPASVAESLVGLSSHTATAFKDSHEKTWILVTGGRRSNGEPLRQALLIDTGNFTIEKLTGGLTCARAGHTALALETKMGMRVVLAGGAEKCPAAIDIFDPTSRAFEKVKLECSLGSMLGIVPEIHSVGTGQTGQTGRIIVPGNPMCIVDPLDGRAVEQEKLSGTAPGNTSVAAVSRTGQMLIVSGKTVFVDYASEDLTCHPLETWQPGAIWDTFELDNGIELIPLNHDRFMLLGTGDTEGGKTGFGWAVITPYLCTFFEVYEGARMAGLPGSGFAPIELYFDREILVLFTGGRSADGEPRDSVFFLRESAAEPESIPPSWHELSSTAYGENALTLRIPRAGHAVATLPSGCSWVIGGGIEPHKPVEIFIRGSAEENPFIPVKKRFESRKPVRTSMVTLDKTPGMTELNQSFAASYPSHLYRGWTGQSVLFLFASVDLGIGDDLIQDIEPNLDGGVTDYCESFDTQSQTEILAVVQGENEEDVVVIGPKGAIPGVAGINAEEYAVEKLKDFANTQDSCSWRQLVRVGLDGLLYGGLEAQEQRSAQRVDGINVLVWVTSGDDCSQGVYEEPGPIPASDTILDHCDEPAFDNYFKLPPTQEEWGSEFTEILDTLVDDPRDLIVAIVGNVGEDASKICNLDGSGKSDDEPLELNTPTRLLKVAEFIEKTGASVITIDICEDGIDDNARLEEGLSHLQETIERRNYAQICVPSEIIPPELIGGGGDDAEAVADEVESMCRVVAVQKNQEVDSFYDNEIYRNVLRLYRGVSGWGVKADTDRRGACVDGWLVTLDDQVSQEFEDVAIVCMD